MDWIVLAILALVIGAAIWAVRRDKKRGGCPGCPGCGCDDSCKKRP